MSVTRPIATNSLGAALERDRLEYRVGRVVVALSALRQRAYEHGGELGAAPMRMRRAIADFDAQLEAINARLRELAPETASSRLQPLSGSDATGR